MWNTIITMSECDKQTVWNKDWISSWLLNPDPSNTFQCCNQGLLRAVSRPLSYAHDFLMCACIGNQCLCANKMFHPSKKLSFAQISFIVLMSAGFVLSAQKMVLISSDWSVNIEDSDWLIPVSLIGCPAVQDTITPSSRALYTDNGTIFGFII